MSGEVGKAQDAAPSNRSVAAKPPPWPRVATHLRLAGRAQFALLPLLVMVVPFTGLKGAPGHDLVGGMFVALTAGEVFLVVLPLVMCCWSALATVGLILEGSLLDPPRELPAWTRVFNLPPRPSTFVAFPFAAVPATAVLVAHARSPALAAMAAIAAALVAYAGAVLVAGVLTAAKRGYDPVPGRLARRFYRRVEESRVIVRTVCWLHHQAGRLTWPPFDGSWDPVDGGMDIDHFVAMGFCVATLFVFAIEAYVFRPWARAVAVLPAGALVMTLGTLLVWVFGALTFHLRRYRLSPVLVMATLAAIGYSLSSYDHHYQARLLATPETLTPVEVVAPVGQGSLVVVTSTGGGILAAGWTTLALERLIAARPNLRDEIRLVSGASGGAVGAAFYIAGLREQGQAGARARPLADVLHEAHDRSTASSLDAVAYGLVLLDLPRLLTGNLAFFWSGMDRGYLLEKRWRNLSAGVAVSVHGLAREIAEGRIPAPIFNLTVMETGSRVMATPVTFGAGDHERAPTLDEYLLAPRAGAALPADAVPQEVDLDMWTAARLSATFPFVSPAARAKIDNRLGQGAAGHHMIDGGYNDNYGVASALDFLTPVMEARRDGRLAFQRLLIIQLRCSSSESPVPAPAPGIEASLVGPLLGILNVRDGATLPRNEAALRQFMRLWRRDAGVDVQTIVFQPHPREAKDEEPLSWHLTQKQKATFRDRWDSQPDLEAKLRRMRAFLDGTQPPQRANAGLATSGSDADPAGTQDRPRGIDAPMRAAP